MQLASCKNIFRVSFLTCLVVAWAVSTPAAADQVADQTYVSSDNVVFNEIELTPIGVVAYDTLGDRWLYDFSSDRFIPEDEWVGDWGEPDGTDDVPIIPPVEERCTEEIQVKPLQGTVLIGYDEYVDSDIRTYGRVTVRGWVRGGIQSLKGRVMVTESGRVDGDIEAPEIVLKPGAEVIGNLVETGSIVDEVILHSVSTDGMWVVFGFTIFFLVTGFIGFTLAPVKMGNFRNCVGGYPGRSFGLGLLFVILMPMVIMLIAITIIGLPVAILVPPIYVAAMALGIVSFSHIIGERLCRRFTGKQIPPVLSFMTGLGVLMTMWFGVAALLGSNDPISVDIGAFLTVVAILITIFPVFAGVGAALLTRFGFKRDVSLRASISVSRDKAPSPAPPPIPTEPQVIPTVDTPPNHSTTTPPGHGPITVKPPGPVPPDNKAE